MYEVTTCTRPMISKTTGTWHWNCQYSTISLFVIYMYVSIGTAITRHLLSVDGADWLRLHDMFNARDAKSGQR